MNEASGTDYISASSAKTYNRFDDVTDRSSSEVTDVWDHHRVAFVFIICVLCITLLFAVILFILKCLEKQRQTSTATEDGQHTTIENRTTTVLLEPDDQSQASLHGGKRWREKLAELLRQAGLLSATTHQSQFDCEPAAA